MLGVVAAGVGGGGCAWFLFLVWLQMRRVAFPPSARTPMQRLCVMAQPLRIFRLTFVVVQQIALVQYWRLYLAWSQFRAQPHGLLLHSVSVSE